MKANMSPEVMPKRDIWVGWKSNKRRKYKIIIPSNKLKYINKDTGMT